MKALVKYFFLKLGLEILKKKKNTIEPTLSAITTPFHVEEFLYDNVIPSIKYSPWLQDSDFLNTYSQIIDHTLVDVYRCYELWELVEKVYELDNSINFIEVGVWKGGTAGIIGKKLKLLNFQNHFYIADTFKGVVKASVKDATYKGGEHADTSKEIVQNLMIGKCDNYTILEGIFPNETSEMIPDEEIFGFCHIDVDVYESAKDIVEWIWKRLIVGGVVVFDDYGYSTCTGITRFVNEQKNLKDRLVVYNINGHALMIKIK